MANEPREIPIDEALNGDTIQVTWGKETFWPSRDTGFEVGPLVYTTKILPNETVMDAFKRAWKALDKAAEKMYESKRKGWLSRVKESGRS